MKTNLRVIMAVTLALASASAHAEAYCGPTVVTESLSYRDGRVLILAPWRGDYVTMCSMTVAWKGVDPQVCWVWYSKIENAVADGKKLLIYYPNITQAECATMAIYDGAPAPGMISMRP